MAAQRDGFVMTVLSDVRRRDATEISKLIRTKRRLKAACHPTRETPANWLLRRTLEAVIKLMESPFEEMNNMGLALSCRTGKPGK